jgi:type IV pilus assembly protein PilM
MFEKSLNKTKDTFLKFFPPPSILTMPAFGINLSDHSIKILELIRDSGLKIGKFGDESIPDGVIKSGNINDRNTLRDVLARIRNKYKPSFVRVSLPEEKAYVFTLKIPQALNEEEIRSSIEFQLEDNVPISVDEALFDYVPIVGALDKNNMWVGVSVLSQKIVSSYVSLFQDVGLTPISFEIEAESTARAIVPDGDLSTYMIVDYGRTRTSFSVVSCGVVHYTATAEIGGELILDIIKKQTGASNKEAQDIKNKQGLAKDSKYPELYMSLANIVSVLKDEINKRYIFWHTHEDKDGRQREKIQKIFLVGGNANLFGLEDYLSSSLRVKTERPNVWVNAPFSKDFVPPINFGDSLSYASAIGLSLKDF